MKYLISYTYNEHALTIHTFLSATTAVLLAYFSVIAVPLSVLGIITIIDVITGVIAAYLEKKIKSKTMFKGILKKVLYLALVIVGAGVDYLISIAPTIGITINTKFCFALMVIVFLIINDLVSIIENVNRCGISPPKFLLKGLEKIKTSVDEKTDGN